VAISLGPFRLPAILVVGSLTFFLGMVAFGALGIEQTYLAVPVPLFLGFMAIWPLVKPTMPRETFKDWLAWQLTVMVTLGVLIAAVDLYRAASAVLN